MGKAKPVYQDACEFFSLTYPTFNLRELAKDVVLRLAEKSDVVGVVNYDDRTAAFRRKTSNISAGRSEDSIPPARILPVRAPLIND
jgi:hypothetical protein